MLDPGQIHPAQGLSIPTSFQSIFGSAVYTHTHTVPCEYARPLKMFLVPSLEIFDQLKRNTFGMCSQPTLHFHILCYQSRHFNMPPKNSSGWIYSLKVFLNLHCKQKQNWLNSNTSWNPKTQQQVTYRIDNFKITLVIKSKFYSHVGYFCHI